MAITRIGGGALLTLLASSNLSLSRRSYSSSYSAAGAESISRAYAPRVSGDGVRVQISREALRARTQFALLDRTFGASKPGSVSSGAALFGLVGRASQQEAVEVLKILRAEPIAKRLIGQVTGEMYDGFRLDNPEASLEDFEKFESDVLRSFAQKRHEGFGLIATLSNFQPELVEDFDLIANLVRQGLEDFFDQEREKY